MAGRKGRGGGTSTDEGGDGDIIIGSRSKDTTGGEGKGTVASSIVG